MLSIDLIDKLSFKRLRPKAVLELRKHSGFEAVIEILIWRIAGDDKFSTIIIKPVLFDSRYISIRKCIKIRGLKSFVSNLHFQCLERWQEAWNFS
jgi:hypothetical protein